MNSKKNFFTRKRMILLATAVILLILAIFAFDTHLMVRKYSIEAEEIETPIRCALVTDLHSCYHTYVGQFMRECREILARCKDFVNTIIKPEPTHLGNVIPVSGNGDITND